jgi:signal transduction histidine kinase
VSKTYAVLGATLLLALGVIGVVTELHARADASREAQLRLETIETQLSELQELPWEAAPEEGGDAEEVETSMRELERRIEQTLTSLPRDISAENVDAAQARFAEAAAALNRHRDLVARGEGPENELTMATNAEGEKLVRATGVELAAAGADYEANAVASLQRARYGSAVAILALLAAFGFFYRRSHRATRRLREQELELRFMLAELEGAQYERTRLLARTVEVGEQERIRVARDLHDGPIQQLTAVAFNFDRLERRITRGQTDDLAESVRRIRDDVAREMTSLRRLMSELRPPILDEGGLTAALNDCREQLLGETPTACEVRSTIGNARLAPELETVVYRVVRESLVNVRKHAGASRVQIALERRGNSLYLAVDDDGCGFDREPGGVAEKQFGLLGMRERVESVGGFFRIETARGTGTRIEATMPWRPQAGQPGAEEDYRVAA